MPARQPARHAEEALAPYRAKRRFSETKEPQGGAAEAGARYLIQKHDARRLHYDFRLELNGVLLSWAVTRGPSFDPKDKRLAVRTEDHPIEYGTFEGTIPKGQYGGGTVMLWDTGRWEPIGDPVAGLTKGKLAFQLYGERLRGRWALVRMHQDEKDKRENWLLIKERDEFAGTKPDLLEAETHSVKSGRSMSEIAVGERVRNAKHNISLPGFVEPELATLVERPPHGEGWGFEIKYDGYRAMIAADGPAVRIYTRSGLDWTARFPAVAEAVAKLNLSSCLLDGEIVVIGTNGVTDFGALAATLEGRSKTPLSCFIFDILMHDGDDCRHLPLSARRTILREVLGNQHPNSPLQISEAFKTDGAALLRASCERGLEGLIAKRGDSSYRSGRNADWLKIKCGHAEEFVILGFSASPKRRPFASTLMGLREKGQLHYAGRVGAGFSDAALENLAAWRDAHRRARPSCPVPAEMQRDVIWVEPILVAQIKFAGWTKDRLIRQGRFAGLKEDKPAREVQIEMPKPLPTLKISHPDRVLYHDSGITKADIAAYIQRAAPAMLPFIKDRFVSLVRCPDGVEGQCFFQRHPAKGFGDFWLSQDFAAKDGKHLAYLYMQNAEALTAAVQMGVLEFHIWGSRRTKPQIPDRIVFDLDPDTDVSFETVRKAAVHLRDVLEALALASLPMLSGGKGIHVVVPLKPDHDFSVAEKFSGDIARLLEADAPRDFTATMSKAKRKGKIFIDYFRNTLAATAIAPYSPRARPVPAVAWPCSWAALTSFKSAQDMTIALASEALAAGENGWVDYETLRSSLTSAALKAVSKSR
jgi:bifunctional non-homologous end joining protein LigD